MRQARVTSTRYEKGVCKVDCLLDRSGVEQEDVQVLKPIAGASFHPSEGDVVAVDTLRDGEYIVVGLLNRSPYPQPDHNPDEFSIVLGPETEIKFILNANGKYDATVSASGSVTVESKNVSLGKDNVENSIRFGEDSATKSEVARKGDTVQVSHDGNTYTGEITEGSSVTKTQ